MLTVHRSLALLVVLAGGASAAETPPPINFEAAYADGVNAFVAHRYALAEQSLEDAVRVGSDPAAWMFKGLAERAQGKHAEAQESIHQAASLRAGGVAGRASVNRAMERIQGDFRLYLDDVEKYYVRTGHTPGDVIAGAASPIAPADSDAAQPAVPTPPKPSSPVPPAPAPALETTDPAPPAAVPNAPIPTPPVEPLRVTAAKPVAVAEDSPVPAVITGAPVYPLPGVPYAAERMTSAVYAGVGYAAPVPVSSWCVGGGAWLPGSWYGYAYPYYGYHGYPYYGYSYYSYYGWSSPGYLWWAGYPYASW